MRKSIRDQINEQRAKLAEGVVADPGIEVGATQHVGDIREGTPYAVIDNEPGVGEEDAVVIHNPEQVQIMADLARLLQDCREVIREADAERSENESLYRQDVEWERVGCHHAERWIDGDGNLGWRVGLSFVDPSAHKFLAYVSDKLVARGWDNAIAEAWGG